MQSKKLAAPAASIFLILAVFLSGCAGTGQTDREIAAEYDDSVSDFASGQSADVENAVENVGNIAGSAENNESEGAYLTSPDSNEGQLLLISENFNLWGNKDGELIYAVTDLDLNGRLEIIVSDISASDLTPEIYEVNESYDGLDKCPYGSSYDGYGPSAGFYPSSVCVIPDSGTYCYLFEYSQDQDDGETYVFHGILALSGGTVYCVPVAEAHITVSDGQEYVFYYDSNGSEISGGDFEDPGYLLGGYSSSSVFLSYSEDIAAEDLLSSLTDSFSCFSAG